MNLVEACSCKWVSKPAIKPCGIVWLSDYDYILGDFCQFKWRKKMKFRTLTILVLSCIFFYGCAATLPMKEPGENNALVFIRSVASGSYFIGIGVSFFGNEPLQFILKSKNSGKEYVCNRFNSSVCVAANIPAGEYEVTTANSPLKQPIVGIPVKVKLDDYKFDLSVEPDVNYVGKFVVKTKQGGAVLKVASWETQVLSSEDKALIDEILAKNAKSGWKMSSPDVSRH